MITDLIGGALGLLGRAGGARRRQTEEAGTEDAPDSYANAYGVPLGRARPQDDAASILDRTMNYSPDRNGRISRGIYSGKTPAEAARAAQREAENRRRNNIGGGDVGRIGSDRSDYAGGEASGFSVPISRASSGLDRHNKTVMAARAAADRRASGDMRGVSFWRNNGNGTATAGSYGADNKAKTRTRDIVSRVGAGETRVMQPGERAPKAAKKDEHLIFEGLPGGRTQVQAYRI